MGGEAQVAGAILTGGRSSRMGRDKAFVEIDGVGMVRRVAASMAIAGVDPIAAIGGDHVRLGAEGIETVEDEWPGEGPLGAIITALHWASTPYVFVAACDLALLSAPTISRMLGAITEDDDRMVDVVVAETGRIEPLCGIWRHTRSTVETLQAAFDDGQRAVHRVLGALRIRCVAVDSMELWNFNTPEDLP